MSHIVVIGAGVNGLAAALELSRQGKTVTIVERRDDVGGLSGRRVLDGGFSIPGVRHGTHLARAALIDALGLKEAGLKLKSTTDQVFASSAMGEGLLLDADAEKSAEEIGRHNKDDAAAYRSLRAFLGRVAPVIEGVLSKEPPPLLPRAFSEYVDVGLLGLSLRRLGKDDMTELLRAIPMCVADFLREQFKTELLSSTLALPAVLGDFAGPWSPGTSAQFILDEAVRNPGVKGGPGAVVDALLSLLKSRGVTIETSAEVVRVRTERGVVKGVTLVTGKDISADVVVGCCDPKQVMGELLAPLSLSVVDNNSVPIIRTRGTMAKVHLGLKEHIKWRARPDKRFARVSVAEHLDDIERAFDDMKYRRFAEKPVLDVWVPSVDDSGCAPDGKDVVSIGVGGVPHELALEWSQETREALLDTVLETLEHHAPGVRDSVEVSEVLTPADLEEEYGLSGGSMHHVERALDQVAFMRPSRAFASYKTPISGLYLGSSGSHGGPGLTLIPGVLAARRVLSGH